MPDDPDIQARVIYLALLGAALAVGVFSVYRHRMGQAVQHAAIWGLIFVGVILAVAFLEPLKQSLFNDEPQAIDDRTIQLRQARDGHFYATLQINGQPMQFLIDTGASEMVLRRADAEAAGIETDGLDYWVKTQTANGESTAAVVRLESVELGPYTDRDVRALIAGGDLNKSLLGMRYLELFSGFRRDGDRFYLTR